MKVRDSGMPDSATAGNNSSMRHSCLRQLGFDDPRADAVDFGCGYGTFSIAAAQMTAGTVRDRPRIRTWSPRPPHAPASLRARQRPDDRAGLRRQRNRLARPLGPLCNALQPAAHEAPLRMLREASRVLAPGRQARDHPLGTRRRNAARRSSPSARSRAVSRLARAGRVCGPGSIHRACRRITSG